MYTRLNRGDRQLAQAKALEEGVALVPIAPLASALYGVPSCANMVAGEDQ